MILEVVQSKWSLTWYDPLGPRMCVLELMNGHVLQTLREQLKVPGSRLEGSELLTSEFLRFRSRLNETSGGLGKIGAVSGSDCRILKFLRTTFLAAKLLGWKVSVKGIRSSLSEADGSKADSASDNEERIPFTLTFHPNNLAARNVVLRNFKILQSDPETAPIFPNPPLVSFKRDRNLRNSLVRSSLPSNLEPGTFNCSRKVCNTCPFINSKTHIRGPNGSYQVNDHFDCTTSNIIYCITCTLCNKLYIGESGRKLGDRFREHLLDVKNKGSDLSKPVARHFNLPDHSHEHMEICGIYLHLGNNETRKRKEQTLIFKLGTLAPNGINERFSFA